MHLRLEERDRTPDTLRFVFLDRTIGSPDFDDHTLGRWLSQTLSQLSGKAWRLSHPLVGAYRLGAQLAHEEHIWLKRLAMPPANFREAPCCRAPILPLLTRSLFSLEKC